MKDKGLDQRIIHAFTMAYLNLQKSKQISEEELDEVLNTIDRLKDYSPETLKKRIDTIFLEK